MYRSPITIIESTIDSFTKSIIKQKDDAIFAEIQHSFGVDMDKEELIRALRYDRNQYEKGYADGKTDTMASIVRCKDCTFCNYHPSSDGYKCCSMRGMYRMVAPNEFCSWGERKDNER